MTDEAAVRTVERPTWTEVWHCEQPEAYRVLRDEWVLTDGRDVRHVYEVSTAQ